MSLQIHRAERADRLVEALGELLSTPLPDPFATEIVSVPTPGVERWLAQRLSRRLGASPGRNDGICAGVDFCSPRRLVGRAVGEALGREPELDPWQPERAVWPLLRVIDGCRGEAWASLLWSYLGDQRADHGTDPVRGGRRWSTARHLADLFAAYAVRRPAMVTAWAEGRDVDGAGRPLRSDRAWQAELWRRLATELGGPHPPELVQAVAATLRTDPGRTGLPERLSVFGVTRLDSDHRQVLDALAVHRDVHLWLVASISGPLAITWPAANPWTRCHCVRATRASSASVIRCSPTSAGTSASSSSGSAPSLPRSPTSTTPHHQF